VKKKHSLKVARGFFVVVVALCTGSLAVALASARPSANIHVQTSLRPGTTVKGAAQPQVNPGYDQAGRGSWYALGLPAPDSLTCASRTFGRGTYLEVKNMRNGKTVICRVNDYGPEVWTGRVIDLSRGSFREVESLGAGTIPVQIRVVPAPLGINLRLPNVVGEILGYARCSTEHDGHFCELNRQAADLLK
jgi:rare lipoprotein A